MESNPATRSRSNYSRLLKTMSSQVLVTSKAGDSTTPLDNSVQYLATLTVEKYFSYVLIEFNVLQFMYVAFVLSQGITEAMMALSSVLHQVFLNTDKIHLNLLVPRPNSSSSLSFSLYERCFCILIIFVALFWIFSNMSMSFLN